MKYQRIVTLLLAFALAGACAPSTPPAPTPDVNAIYTSAAYTVVAEFTLTAAAFSPTPEPPTETPTPELPTATSTVAIFATNEQGTPLALCDSMTFGVDVDVNIPDGTEMVPNQTFTKTWKIKNDGACAWGSGYGLIYAYGEKMSGKPQPLATVVEAGQEVEVSVDLKAPDKPGEYLSAWQMANAKGIPFGKPIYLKIIVK
jgi:next-to-BRCA1 protein 1